MISLILDSKFSNIASFYSFVNGWVTFGEFGGVLGSDDDNDVELVTFGLEG